MNIQLFFEQKWAEINNSGKSKIKFYVWLLFGLFCLIIFDGESGKVKEDTATGTIVGMGSFQREQQEHFKAGMVFPSMTVCNSPWWKDDQLAPDHSACKFTECPECPDVKLKWSNREDIIIELSDGKRETIKSCYDVSPRKDVFGPGGEFDIQAKNHTMTVQCEIIFHEKAEDIKNPLNDTWTDQVFVQFWGGNEADHKINGKAWTGDGPLKEIGFWKVFTAYTHNLVELEVLGVRNEKHKPEGFMYIPKISFSQHQPMYKQGDPTKANIPKLTINYSFDQFFYKMLDDISSQTYNGSYMFGVVGGWWFFMSLLVGLVSFLLIAFAGYQTT